MKPVRVGTALYHLGPLACPRCGRRDPTHLAGYGILRPTCQGPSCRASWTAVRLPPGCTGRQLMEVIGPVAGGILMESVQAENPAYQGMDPEAIVLPGGTHEAIYVQRAPDSPEPLMGWRKAQQIMNVLMGTDEDTERKGAA